MADTPRDALAERLRLLPDPSDREPISTNFFRRHLEGPALMRPAADRYASYCELRAEIGAALAELTQYLAYHQMEAEALSDRARDGDAQMISRYSGDLAHVLRMIKSASNYDQNPSDRGRLAMGGNPDGR